MTTQFSSKFIFGVADADLQVIGENNTRKHERSEETMWSHFARTSSKCYNNQTPGIGIDRYHLWRKDIEIMKKMRIKHYRTSVSMSRILKRNGEINTKAIKWYQEYFKNLRKAGIKIYATLYHWELPQFLSEQGGWKNRKTIDYLNKHAIVVAKHLGEFIEEFFILNEPWCSSILSYYFGIHAPGEKNLKDSLLAAHNLLLSLGTVYNSLRSLNSNFKISTVFNAEMAYPMSSSPKDVLAAKYADGYFNRWFMDPLFLGDYPKDMVELYGKQAPSVNSDDMKVIKIGSKLYTFGLNYYCGRIVKYDRASDFKFKPITKSGAPTNDLGWPIFNPPYYPQGLYDLLIKLHSSYGKHGLKSIYIAENGIALNTPWNQKDKIIDDSKRIDYIKKHLQQVRKAILRGIPINAYFAWTLMDNYEWAEGYRPEASFGLIHVDRRSLKRVPKKSSMWYADLIKTKILK